MVSTPPSDGPERTTSELAIDAEDVHVTYDDGTEAVAGVDLAVESGEFFGFLGPNGAGKTTTVRALATLLSPTRGSVRIEGHDAVGDPQAVRRSIGYMAQETSVDPELTPRENLRVACRVYGVPPGHRADRIEELLELVDLRDAADRRAETFSGGMKKRLDAATVLVHRPPVVFLDEPTTGLDPEARLRLWEYFEAINDRGTTVFLTTQYLEEADRLCDRIALLEAGEVVATGSPDSLKAAVGADTLSLRLSDPTERNRRRAAETVRGTGSLAGATVETTPEGVAVTGGGVRAAADDVFVALSHAGFDVAEFEVSSPTLDDVFLALTGDDAGDFSAEDAEHGDGDAVAAPEVAR